MGGFGVLIGFYLWGGSEMSILFYFGIALLIWIRLVYLHKWG